MSFWDVVLVTASSERQAALYRDEIERRRQTGMLPEETEFLVVPDPDDRRVGSGGATINALGVLGKDKEWWRDHRALLIHSGGDSRGLPQYSPVGKLFGVLPSRTQPRGTTTVFDETMTLSAAWAEGVSSGLLVASGDVVLRFDASRRGMGSAGRNWRGDAAGCGDGQPSRRVCGGSRRPGLYLSAEAYVAGDEGGGRNA